MGSMVAWKTNKNDLIKTILTDKFLKREEAIKEEIQLIKENINNPLNKNYNIPGLGFHNTGRVFEKSVRDKMRLARLGDKNPRYGNPHSEETKEKIRIGGEASSIINNGYGELFDTILLNDVLDQYDISILKMDIEGSEYSCINSLKDLKVDQVCIEWHHWLGDMFTIQETLSCIDKIKSFGYTEVVRESENPPKRYIKESIFIKSSLIS
jgi:hypothetical protein